MTHRPTARGRIKLPRMNATEQRYAQYLEVLKRTGEIVEFWFEGIKLRLADNTFYNPDFLVMKQDYTLELHELKGGKVKHLTGGPTASFYAKDDAMVKIKVAAQQFPFRLVVVYPVRENMGGGWKFQEF